MRVAVLSVGFRASGMVSVLLPGLAAVCLLAALPAQAQWKWRDQNGQVTISDRPPPLGVPDKDILARPAPESRRAPPPAAAASAAASASAPGKGPLDRELEARKRAADQDKAAKAKAEEDKQSATRADNCRRARGQMAALEGGQRMARVNEKGEREVLDDRGRAEEMRQAREVIGTDCR